MLQRLLYNTMFGWHMPSSARLVLDIFGWARLAFRPDCITLEYRDVNSREIAFPGRESQFPGLDQDSISPDYVLFAGVIGVGSLAGARRGGRSPASLRCYSGRCGDPVDR